MLTISFLAAATFSLSPPTSSTTTCPEASMAAGKGGKILVGECASATFRKVDDLMRYRRRALEWERVSKGLEGDR